MHAVETMAWAGERPWHGLGQEITNPDDLVSGDAFMRAAGLDWTVEKVSLCYGPEHPFLAGDTIPNEYHLIRSMDGAHLSETPVTEFQYNIRQNSEMFAVFDPFLASGEMTLNTAGSLFNGRRVWVLAQLTTGFSLAGDDTVNNFLLFTINHSGMDANTAFYTPVRVVCNNTMRQAESTAKHTIRDNHKRAFDVDLMRGAIELVKDQSVEFEQLAIRMADYRLTGEESVDFFRKVYNKGPVETDSGKLEDVAVVRRALGLYRGQETRTQQKPDTKNDIIRKQQEQIDALLRGVTIEEFSEEVADLPDENVNPGWNMESSEQTLWGAYNVITFMEDHSPYRKSRSEDHQLQRSLYGAQSDRKVDALNAARDLIAA